MSGVERGFHKGLVLMNDAMQLGERASSQLREPDYTTTKPTSKAPGKVTRKPAPVGASEITFRSLAEDFAGQHDLVFLPTGRSDPQSGKPLFRVSRAVDGKKGVTVYVGPAAVFAQEEGGVFRAITLEEMVKRGLT